MTVIDLIKKSSNLPAKNSIIVSFKERLYEIEKAEILDKSILILKVKTGKNICKSNGTVGNVGKRRKPALNCQT